MRPRTPMSPVSPASLSASVLRRRGIFDVSGTGVTSVAALNSSDCSFLSIYIVVRSFYKFI